MEDVLGPLILLLLAVGAGIQKLIAQRQESQRRRTPPVKAKDLPEKTRRQLYGQKAVPGQRAPMRSERVRELARGQRRALEETTVPRRQPREVKRTYEPRVARPAQERPAAAPPAARQARPVAREAPAPRQVRPQTAQPVPQWVNQAKELVTRLHQRVEEAQGRQPRQVRPERPQSVPPVRRAVQRPRRRPVQAQPQLPERPVVPTPSARRKSGLANLFADMDSLRRGIVFYEILSPPKAFR